MRKVLWALSLALPLTLAAEEPSYSYIEGGASVVDPPGRFGSSDTGIQVRGSYAFDPLLFVRGGIQSNSFSTRRGPPGERTRESVDRDLLSLGLGFRVPTEQDLDVYGAADILFDIGDADDAGFRLEGGVRAALPPEWDLAAGLRVGRIDSHTNAQVFGNAFYAFAPPFAAGAELAVGDFDEVMIGFRYMF